MPDGDVDKSPQTPWPLTCIEGVCLGAVFDGVMAERYQLKLQQRDPDDESDCWEGDEISVNVRDNRIVGIVCWRRATVKGLNLIGASLVQIAEVIGAPTKIDELPGASFYDYEHGDLALSLYIVDDKVSHAHLLDYSWAVDD